MPPHDGWSGLRSSDRDAGGSGAAPAPTGAIAATLLTGLAAAIPPDDRAAFRDSGLAHLLAIAGLHVGIVMGLAFGLTRFACWRCRRGWRCTCRSSRSPGWLRWWPAAATCCSPARMCRSCAASRWQCLVTLGLLSGRRAASLRGLSLAAGVIILVAPEQILGVSFQMSFSAVLALIAGYEALRPALAWLRGDGEGWRRVAHVLAGLALTSLLAGSASAPFAAFHFGHMQLYFVLANMIAVPLTALWIMPAGLLALLLLPLGLAGPVLTVMGWGIALVLVIAHAVAAWPAAIVAIPHGPAWGLLATAFGMAWLGLWRSRMRLAGLPVLLLGVAAPCLITLPDLLVSPDARLIALRTPAGVVAQAAGASKFAQADVVQFWADGPLRPLPPELCSAEQCLLRARPDGGHRSAAAPRNGGAAM